MTDIQVVMTKLLIELDSLLSDNKIAYCLGDRLAWDATKFGGFHDKTIDAVVLVDFSSKEALASILTGLPNRVFLQNGDFDAFYVAADTTLLDLRFPLLEVPGVAVRIKFIDKGEYVGPDGSFVTLDFDVFEKLRWKGFEGHIFPVPEPKDYFSAIVSPEWNHEKWPYYIACEATEVVAEMDINAYDFVERVLAAGIDIQDLSKEWQSLYAWDKKEFRAAKKAVNANNRILQWTVDRYRFALEFATSKTRLVSFWQRGKKAAVEEALADYLDAMVDYFKKTGNSMCVDPEIFEIAVDILKDRPNFGDLANQMAEAVPENYSSNLVEEVRRFLA